MKPAVLFAAVLMNVGCAGTPIGYESGVTAPQRDVLHRSTERPRGEAEPVFVEHTEVAVIGVPPAELLDWIVNVPLERTATAHSCAGATASAQRAG